MNELRNEQQDAGKNKPGGNRPQIETSGQRINIIETAQQYKGNGERSKERFRDKTEPGVFFQIALRGLVLFSIIVAGKLFRQLGFEMPYVQNFNDNVKDITAD